MIRQRSNAPKQQLPNEIEESEESEDDDCQVGSSKQPVEQENGGLKVVWIIGTVIIALVLLLFFLFVHEPNPDHEKIKIALQEVILNIKSKFPTQDERLWGYLLSVLATVSSPDSKCPKVILLLDQADGQTQKTSHCFVKMVANQSAPILPFKEKKALYLNGDDLNCTDCVEVQREKVKGHGIVIIQHLEKFPTASAESLHFFCDEYEADFAKAAYLLTMTVSNIEKDPTKTAENALRSAWRSIQKDNLDALISRLTSLVVFVRPEVTPNCD